ncbi:MAG TPA: Smr/MutS family protein [Polyangiaceae bacterium]|nr:Smr/MutS family protein [Polyangiaceae bacterium]
MYSFPVAARGRLRVTTCYMTARVTALDSLEQRTLQVLEWQRLLEQLAAHCVSEVGAVRLGDRRPAASIEEARRRCRLLAQALELDALAELYEMRAFPDLGAALSRARVSGTLTGSELRDVSRVLELAGSLRAFAAAQREARPELAQALASEPSLDRLQERLSRAIDPDGTVSDHASPALREAREKSRQAREELKRRLEESMRRLAPLLSGQYVTEREGRYVLPVRADAPQRVEGVVLGTSGSGGTLFVEPSEVTDYGNRLKIREAAVEREVAKVLEELTREVSNRVDAVEQAFEACVDADQLLGLCSWSRKAKAHAFEPESAPVLELRAMRHPLLLAGTSRVVENDIVACGGRALIISGPNAGGKTVALKCLGLAAWMARAGLPIPADEESRIGWFGDVLCDLGDEQSLARNLSTFSAHLLAIAAILERSGPDSLVLLDELAAGTDPEEGAALAAATLEALTARGAAVVVTTHYERLKELAAEGKAAFDNASVGFDFEAMAPTFKLLLGVPGPSSALAVARRFGLPEDVVARAREHLPAHAIAREEVVRKLEQERSELERERGELRAEIAAQAERRAELEAELEKLERRDQQELERESRELIGLVRQARAEVREARQRLKEPHGGAELRDIERSISRAATHVAVGGTVAQRAGSSERTAPPANLEAELLPGSAVRLRNAGTLAIVEALPERGQVRLRAGSLRLTVPLREIESVQGRAKKPSATKRPQTARSTSRSAHESSPVRTSDTTLDVRGERVDDALTRVDGFLDQLLGEGHGVGFVLHGHGTGALKSALREHLAASRYVGHVRAAEPDEGGDAFTVFWIKD